jgi:hypothetical protein
MTLNFKTRNPALNKISNKRDFVNLNKCFASFILVIVSINSNLTAQLRLLPLEHFYRDRVFGVTLESDTTETKNHEYRNFGAFFPVLESESYRVNVLSEPTNRKTWFGRKLFDEHFYEYQNDEFFVTFDILADLTIGRDLWNPENKNYFINTRGVHVNGGIGKYFGFFSNLRENQARFLEYQVDELRKGSQTVINSIGNQVQSGAFVSGGARTKGFKGDGFDFAYATGGVLYRPFKTLVISFGNNPIFIGAGHRSLFYSDHSNMFPHLRTSWRLNRFFSAEIIYAQHLNLIHMQLNTPRTERLYEKKGFTIKYINFAPLKSLQLSLFEGTSWLRYDNDNVRKVHTLYYNPLPFINTIVLSQQGSRHKTILGGQILWNPLLSLHLYSQVAYDEAFVSEPSIQIGTRLAEPFQIRDLHILLEANRIPKRAYGHNNPRLNYINNNISLAHPMGAGVDEIVGRISYEWRRIGISLQANAIRTVQNMADGVNGIPLAPRPIPSNANFQKVLIRFGQIDLLYRFNKKSNLQVFSTMLFRQERISGNTNETLYLGFGMRTPLSNRYFDL